MRKLYANNEDHELGGERYSEMITEYGEDLEPPVKYQSWEGNYEESGDKLHLCLSFW